MSEDYTDNARWWLLKGYEQASCVANVVNALYSQQSFRRDANWRHARMYGNYLPMGMAPASAGLLRPSLFEQSRLSLNVVKNMVDAVGNKITKTKPKPMYQTSGGDYFERKKAKDRTKFTEGQFYEHDAYDVGKTVFTDARIYGTGLVKVCAAGDEIELARLFPWEWLVDEIDGRNGNPRNAFQIKPMDKMVLTEEHPKLRDAIMSCSPTRRAEFSNISVYSPSVIEVREAWHLPSSKYANDGRHVIAIDNAILLDEPYTRTYFPVGEIRWSKAPYGYWGIGLAEELFGIQIEINSILRSIQAGYHLLGKSHWMVEGNSKVLSTSLDNDLATIIRYVGNPPQIYVPQVIPPEIYQHLWQLYNRAYEIAGVSQLTAQGEKPAGLNSGEAIRTYANIETERFSSAAQDYEKLYLTIAKLMRDAAEDIYEEYPDYKVRVSGKNSFEWIKWDDVRDDDENYVMKLYPVNAFSSEPAAKKQEVAEMYEKGLIDLDTSQRLLDFPDIEQFQDYRFAPREIVDRKIALILDEGNYSPLPPYADLQNYALPTVQGACCWAEDNGVPEERLKLLRKFLSDIVAALMPKEPQLPPADGAAMAPMPPPMPPEGMPQAPGPMPPMPPDAMAMMPEPQPMMM